MAFVKKTWTDRMSQYPTRRVLTDTTTGTTQTVTVARSEGEVSQTGDAFSAANMNDLENRIQAGINAAHSDADVLLPLTVGWVGKNQAYSQTNNAVIASIESGKSYKVAWTGSATVTLKKNSSSGAEVTSGDTSPLSFTADADYDLYFGSSASVTNIMVYDASIADNTYEPYHDTVDACKLDITSLAPVEKTSIASQAYAVDEYFVKDGKLCRVTLPITAGGTLTKNTNYVETLISSEFGSGSGGSGNISYGTGNPSGGNDGDLYIKLDGEVPSGTYRYIKFDVLDNQRSDTTIMFDGFSFVDENNTSMPWPAGSTVVCNQNCAFGADAIFYEDNASKYVYTYGRSATYTITLPENAPLDILTYTKYKWKTGNATATPSEPGFYPKTWKLYLSNDGTNWTEVDSVVDFPIDQSYSRYSVVFRDEMKSLPTRIPNIVDIYINSHGYWCTSKTGFTASYGTNAPTGGNDGDIYLQLNREPTILPTSWRYMKFEIDAVRGTALTQLATLRFYNKAGTVMTYPSFTYTCNVGNARGDQTPYQLLTGGKYCSNNNTRPVVIVYDFATNIDLATYNYYRWSTGGDIPERDPITWKLYFSNDGENFTLFDSVENYPVTTERNAVAYEKKLLLDPPNVVNVWVNTNGTWRSDYFPTLDNVVSNIEVTNTATLDYAVGEYLFKQGTLYRVISAITAGSAFVVNTNIVPVNIMDEITASIIVGTIPISRGGTGNTVGYIQTGKKANTTVGTGATIEGTENTVSGNYSHAEGSSNKATAVCCHVEGSSNEATANNAHAEGSGTKATGNSAHAEGATNTASGHRSHAGGNLAYAQAENAFAHGYGVYANGKQSIALGQNLQAGYDNQCVVGKCNSNKSTSIFEVGIGTGTNARANGLELDTSGNLKTAGTITDGNGNVLGGSSGNKVFVWDSQYTDASTDSFSITLSELPTFNVGDILILKIHANLTYNGNYGWGFTITIDSSSVAWSGNTKRISTFSGYDVKNFTDDLELGTCLTFVCITVSNNMPTLLLVSKDVVESSGGSGVATSVIGTEESGSTASQAYIAGEYFVKNDAFCRVVQNINQGSALTLNTNYKESTIGSEMLKNAIPLKNISNFPKELLDIYVTLTTSSGTANDVLNNQFFPYFDYTRVTSNTKLYIYRSTSDESRLWILPLTSSYIQLPRSSTVNGKCYVFSTMLLGNTSNPMYGCVRFLDIGSTHQYYQPRADIVQLGDYDGTSNANSVFGDYTAPWIGIKY